MKNQYKNSIHLFITILFMVSPVMLFADEQSVRFNNENWFTLPHPKVAEFTVRPDGSAYGMTENGIPFVQKNIPNTLGIRVQRFEIEDHYHYIIEGRVVYTHIELSRELAREYHVKTKTT